MVEVNKPDEDQIKGAKTKKEGRSKRTITNRTEAVFSEDEQEFVMEVEVEGQDTDFSNEIDQDMDQDEGDMGSVATSEIISFKQNKRSTGSNNNVTKEQREVLSEGEISSDQEELEKSINRQVVNPNVDGVAGTSDRRVTERNKEKEEFIDAAVAKFQDVLLNGSFVQAMAQMVQKQLEAN